MHVTSVNLGSAQPSPRGRGRQTGIYKLPTAQLLLTPVGVDGDAVLDRRWHGGPSKAVCVFCGDHYPSLAQAYPDGQWTAGAFGENLTLTGLDEESAHVGDIFSLGDVRVQISQPRGPCATLAGRHGIRDFVAVCLRHNWTGWYLRVLAPGVVRAGTELVREWAHPLAVSIAEANAIRYDSGASAAAVARLLAVDALSDSWREDLEPAWRRG